MTRLKVLVDGSNIAFATYQIIRRKKIAKLSNIKLIISFLTQLEKKNPKIPISFFILCDSTLRHKIDCPDKLEDFIRQGKVIQSPAGTKTDDFLLNYLMKNRLDTYIISNDTFQQYPNNLEKHKKSWRIPYMIFDNQILIPKLEYVISRTKNNTTSMHELKVQPIKQFMEQCQ